MFAKVFYFLRAHARQMNPPATAGKLIAFACYCMAVSQLHGQPAPLSDQKFWMPDGPINAILVTNGTLYIGGDFSYVGPRTGPVGLFDQATGGLLDAPPRINGIVKATVPDGSGGWFIGGTFTRIGTAAITNVAHLNPDLTPDTGWNAKLVGTAVNALALDNGRLYVGGQYSRIGGQVLSSLAGVDASTAEVNWNPAFSGTVNAMQVSGGLLYVGGTFFSVGNSNRQNLAAISTTTALANAWDPEPVDQAVLALEVSGNTVYVGGQFTTIGSAAIGLNKPRNRLAALDATTGGANAWNPNPGIISGTVVVRAIAVSGSTVYVGGDFTSIGGQSRRGFGALNSGNGAAQSLNLQLQSLGTANLVRSILVQGNSLYVGGQFTNALTVTHPLVVGVDITSSQAIPVPLGTDFNGTAGAVFGANAMASANGHVLIVGDFQSIGGVTRQRAAALSLTTGAALPWAPGFDGPVLSMAYGTNRIYVGGSFTNYNTTNLVPQVGFGLGAVDPVNGNPVPFAFLGTNGFSPVSINTLVVTSNALYAGGAFTFVAGQPRRYVAELDPATGNLISDFNANLTGGGAIGVSSMVLAGTNLYLAGDFTTVNAVSFPRLTVVSSANGSAIDWTPIPSPNQVVSVLAATPDTLYVGGQFSTISGVALKNFAAYSLVDNSLLFVDASLPVFANGVTAIGATPTTLYVGGSFTSIGGEFRYNLGCLGSFNASAYGWDPSPDVGPSVITLTDDYAFLGGSFRFLGQSPTNEVDGFLAVFSRAPQASISSTSGNAVQILTTTGDRTDAVLLSTTNLASPSWTSIATNDTPGSSWTVVLPTTRPQQYFRVLAR